MSPAYCFCFHFPRDPVNTNIGTLVFFILVSSNCNKPGKDHHKKQGYKYFKASVNLFHGHLFFLVSDSVGLSILFHVFGLSIIDNIFHGRFPRR